MPAVEVHDLVKEFPQRGGGVLRAVDGISFDVAAGEVFGFLGPNGAGKTTSLEIMETLQRPTSGTATVLGLDVARDADEIKRRVGIQLQAGAYFEYLTLREILHLFGSFYPRRLDPDALLKRVDLTEKADALIKQLSGGQQQRFSIVASIVNDPEVVFLDEATTGLDPRARREVWELTRGFKADGKTIVLTTHYLEEAQELCDRVAIIDRGRIVALDTPANLVRSLGATYRIVFETKNGFDPAGLAALPGVIEAGAARGRAGGHELRVHKPTESLPALMAWTEQTGVVMTDLQVLPATLEDVFLARTGRALGEAGEAGDEAVDEVQN
jgi:ABC-2 type transport system ATP-binding protein